METYSYRKTIQLIADILSFESTTTQLEKTLCKPSFNWDAIVIEGSKHLVLPAIYCRLKARQLLHVLPDELESYLNGITSINRNRNVGILEQVHSISKLLNAHHIEHVFLKGTAHLALGCYRDAAERMVGDIDILVKKSQILTAFNLLKTNGYNKTYGYAYKKKHFRHLDRLISDTKLAAIELHTDLLNKKHKSLLDISSVLESAKEVNAISIPSSYYLSKHHILGWQINDRGHYYKSLSLKSLYDALVLKANTDNTLILSLLKLKYGQSYLELAKYYFKEFSHISSNNYMRYIRFQHKINMSFKPLRIVIRQLKRLSHFITSRLYLVFSNGNYTKHLIKKIFLYKKD